MIKYTIWYSVQDFGDGSAYPIFMQSEELCRIDQHYQSQGWGEDCIGSLVFESESPIVPNFRILTVEDMIESTKQDINDNGNDYFDQRLEDKLDELEELL